MHGCHDGEQGVELHEGVGLGWEKVNGVDDGREPEPELNQNAEGLAYVTKKHIEDTEHDAQTGGECRCDDDNGQYREVWPAGKGAAEGEKCAEDGEDDGEVDGGGGKVDGGQAQAGES